MGLVRTMPSSGQRHRPGLKASPSRTHAGSVRRGSLSLEDPAGMGASLAKSLPLYFQQISDYLLYARHWDLVVY